MLRVNSAGKVIVQVAALGHGAQERIQQQWIVAHSVEPDSSGALIPASGGGASDRLRLCFSHGEAEAQCQQAGGAQNRWRERRSRAVHGAAILAGERQKVNR